MYRNFSKIRFNSNKYWGNRYIFTWIKNSNNDMPIAMKILLYTSITSVTIFFFNTMQKYRIKSLGEIDSDTSLSKQSYNERQKNFEKLFYVLDNSIKFKSNDSDIINGNDIITKNDDRFYLIYFGYPNCDKYCSNQIKLLLKTYKQMKQRRYNINKIPKLLFIDINVFDDNEKVSTWLNDIINKCELSNDVILNDDIIGLIPENRESLGMLMNEFYISIQKDTNIDSNELNSNNLKLIHSNVVYLMNNKGILNDCFSIDYNGFNINDDLILKYEQQFMDDIISKINNIHNTKWSKNITNILSMMMTGKAPGPGTLNMMK